MIILVIAFFVVFFGLREMDLIEPLEPLRQSVAFKDGGYYVMRDGWHASGASN